MPSSSSISPTSSFASMASSIRSIASRADLTRSPASSASLPSLSDGNSSASSSSIASLQGTIITPALRPFEHLAVLLPRDLWKRDYDAPRCDSFACGVRFSLVERRHHCRKCGFVFCGACSSRSTPLLDTSTLDFLHPPKDTPLSAFATPEAPLQSHRVCDTCYNQIHGIAHKPLPIPAIATAPAPEHRRRPRRRRTVPRSPVTASPQLPAEVPLPPDLAELATYPLRFPSAVCKASGGGRWVPAPAEDPAVKRVPGRLPAYEAALENEEAARRRALLNPVITDGEFRMRRPVDRAAILAAQACSA